MVRVLIFMVLMTLSLFSWKMEADTMVVKNTTNGVITHIVFRQNYDTVPLIFTLATDTGANSATLRVMNITKTGFDVYIVEPDGDDGFHGQMSAVPYIAIEEGEHELPNGSKIVALKTSTNKFQSRLIVGESSQSISIDGFVSTPVVLGQIQSRNSERTDIAVPSAVSQPWMTTAIYSVTSAGFEIALERSETQTGNIQNEDIAYLVMESGLNGGNNYFASSEAKKIEYETIRSNKIIKGWDNSAFGYVINFFKTYRNPVVIATKNTGDGVDGGWLRRRSISTSSIALVVDEDIAIDSERLHLSERVGLVLFSEPFDVEFIYNGQAVMQINEVMYQETIAGSTNNEFIEFYVTQSGDLQGFVLSDQDTHEYLFPQKTVFTGDYVIVHTEAGSNSSIGTIHHLYMGLSPIWNNTNDDVLLLQPSQDITSLASNKFVNGIPLDYISYGRNSVGGNIDAIPISLNGVTLTWTYDYGAELDNAIDGQSIALTPNTIDSNKAGCWELTSSGNASDNGCIGYLPTRDTNTDATLTYSMGESNTASPKITLNKTSLVTYDPINELTNPKAIPGAIIKYTIVLKNQGLGTTDNNTIHVRDTIPTNMRICVSTVGQCQEAILSQGAIDSTLSLGSISYYSNGSAYIPSADAEGYDDAVSEIKFNLNGSFAVSDGTNHPSANIDFYMGVK